MLVVVVVVVNYSMCATQLLQFEKMQFTLDGDQPEHAQYRASQARIRAAYVLLCVCVRAFFVVVVVHLCILYNQLTVCMNIYIHIVHIQIWASCSWQRIPAAITRRRIVSWLTDESDDWQRARGARR
jgi:hypothetical protein